MTLRPSIFAVVVTYHPGEGFVENLRAVAAEFARVLVVDNGSDSGLLNTAASIPGVEVMLLGENGGIAAAMNRGATRALELGAAWMVTLDQDSRPEPGFLGHLWATHLAFPHAAIVGAHITEKILGREHRWLRARNQRSWRFERVPCDGRDLDDVTMVISSGSLLDLSVWRQLGGFDEGFFIDFVDTDYCLRCRALGRSVVVSVAARLVHHLGKRAAKALLGKTFFPTHHSSFRHYYIARNRVVTVRRHAGREMHWFFYETAASTMLLFRVIAFESEKFRKLGAMIRGTWAGLRGRTGQAPVK